MASHGHCYIKLKLYPSNPPLQALEHLILWIVNLIHTNCYAKNGTNLAITQYFKSYFDKIKFFQIRLHKPLDLYAYI
jgi:hypothetical protein